MLHSVPLATQHFDEGRPTKNHNRRVMADSLDILLCFNFDELQKGVIGRVLRQVCVSILEG